MIPSPTKLALLTGIVLLAGEGTSSAPTRFDQRQEGDLNFRADIEDVVLVAVPPKDYIANGLTWVGGNFIRHAANGLPSRTQSKHGFVPTEKSPYKVDLGKSTVPVMKLDSPVVEEVKLFAIRDGDKSEIEPDQSKIIMSVVKSTPAAVTESKTVKKELKGTTEVAAEETTKKDEEKKKTDTKAMVDSENKKRDELDAEKEKKRKEVVEEEKKKGSVLVVVGSDADPSYLTQHEGCGPMAYRDSKGKCVYEGA